MSESSSNLYGPNTASVRQFLVSLANLGVEEHEAVCHRFGHFAGTNSWLRAESELATTLEDSGRLDLRDAVAGPFMSLVRLRPAGDTDAAGGPEPVAAGKSEAAGTEPTASEVGSLTSQPDQEGDPDNPEFDEIAEPALAMLLALLVEDLLSPQAFKTLTAPFDTVFGVE